MNLATTVSGETMNLVTTVPIEEAYLSKLRDILPDLVIHNCSNEREAAGHLACADIVISDHVSFSAQSLALSPRLKWLQLLNAGAENMPLQELGQRGIQLTNTRGIHKIQMSEYAFAMMLEHTRRMPYYRDLQNRKVWESGYIGDELYGKTVGIIGTGSIGEEIAGRCKAFGMRVIGLNRTGKQIPFFDAIMTYADIDKLLEGSDYIMVLLPNTKETNQLIRLRHFEQMKPTCYFINMARGQVVNEQDLITALQTDMIAGAALDVFEREPLPASSPLWNMENVTVTPHHAGATRHYKDRAFEVICKNFELFLRNQPLNNLIDTRAGY